MPIAALPQPIVRAIGSTSVISDPCSVVKELLDNALDASATSVFVEISQNTVDVIQVKDNGHGIPSSDHAFVCKRTYTSKIQTIDDLRKLGGSSLGFRGEALASAVEVSGVVTVTTRVEAESVGSSIKYGRNGDVASSQRAPHPIGTTVRITDLFKHIPVRRQTALKGSMRTVARIKKLMQEYAIARPSARLSFKVLKAKNEANNWIYAPKHNATMMDAALKVVGTDATSIYALKNRRSCEVSSTLPDTEGSFDIDIQALLPVSNPDFTKVNNAGQFISIDGRPISAAIGIGQDISKLYKSYLRSAISRSPSPKPISDPFLCLQVKSGRAIYDVNIEPAKDDVLFESPQIVLGLIEDLFRDTYGEKEGSANKRPIERWGSIQREHGFELLLARKSPPVTQPTNNTSSSQNATNPQSLTQLTPERVYSMGRPTLNEQNPDTENPSGSSNRDSLNPWSVTKLNTPMRGTRRTLPNEMTSPLFRPRSCSATKQQPCLPSPTTTSISPTATSPSEHQLSSTPLRRPQPSPKTPIPYDPKRASRERDRERYGNGSLDTWFGKTTQVSLARTTSEADLPNNEGELSLSQLTQTRFGSDEHSPSHLTNSSSEGLSNNPQTISVPAVSPPLSLVRPNNEPLEVVERRQECPVLEQWSSRLHRLSRPNYSSDLEEALDFENRKKEAISKRREQIRNRVERPGSANSPHLSRYLAARAALSEEQNPSGNQEPPKKAVLNPHDPRSHLMRDMSSQQLDSIAGDPQVRRALTNKLPFEKIPQGDELHDISLTQFTGILNLSTELNKICQIDLYTKCGSEFEAFSASDLESDLMAYWTLRLSALISRKYKGQGESNPRDVHFDFSSLK
ncbi:hypothetical protein FE257_007333 [Aspergillus nanangensis]|uniref:DNA mismatch repair protein S5 domain-containing protein n=1 Tax=Aspergillus nanangensis TaxID=2582783 RepID=A0AAD4CMX7_ASPNN|nr:hypothetical protein FE257_007333 [Aspergillus nanangensis]